MNIQEMVQDKTAVLIVRGRMVNGIDVAPFKNRVRDLVARGMVEIVVDLSEVNWFGAAMVGALVGGLTMAQAHGGSLRLVGANKRIVQMLVATRLNEAFQIVELKQDVQAQLQLVG